MLLKNILKSSYFKNIVTMIGGVFIAQIITLLVAPFLTRIYPADAFGLIAVFLAITNVITIISTGRYENAILLPKQDNAALSILQATVRFIILTAIVSFLIFLFFNGVISKLLNNEKLENWLYFVPLMVIINGLNLLFRNWLSRKKKFRSLSVGAILKSFTLNIILILGGVLFKSPIVFLVANIIGQLLETLFLFKNIEEKLRGYMLNFIKKPNTEWLLKYINFPKYSLPADLFNIYAGQNPIILFAAFYGTTTVGYFAITQRVMGIPVKLISRSTLEVYKQRASEEVAKSGKCDKVFLKTFFGLALIAIIPTVILFFYAPVLFSFVFGESWIVSGRYARFLLPMFFFQFSVSPLGYTLLIMNKQHINLLWQVGLFIVTSLGIIIGYNFKSSDLSVILFAIGYSIMYIVYFFLSYKVSKSQM